MLQIQSFVFNPFEENSFVLFDESKECIVIDPGCYEPEERYELESFIADHHLDVKLLLNTHCHVDHVLGNYFIKEKYKVRLLIHEKEQAVLKSAEVLSSHYGLTSYTGATPDGFLNEGDEVTFGKQRLTVLFVPGHSPGHIAFYDEQSKSLIGGDVLFYNSIGRTDLPGGSYQLLIDSIHKKLFTLPDNTTVYPGHGPSTTIGYEKRTNPFCAVVNVK
ncbi:MAG TPA: MBL fold metallo-hydrolase [Chryseosolibacter sp.]|nr:MBL fold metallo-hydrolase [Chryseosolibacter sp.]